VKSERGKMKKLNLNRSELNAVCHGSSQNTGIARMLSDIGGKEKLEDQLIRFERLASLGELLSGVAHELNNPLTAISGHAQLLMMDNLDENHARDLQIIDQEAKRASRIVGSLLDFIREHKPEKKPVDVNEIIKKTLEMKAYHFKISNIEVGEELTEAIPPILGDFYQLQQVFLNIINNAQHAMLEAHGRGKLIVRTHFHQQTTSIIIEFIDDGPGIPDPVLDRVFEPFFTTKASGEWTGLGLSLAYGIVREHGGQILAQNNREGGARFVTELPARAESGSNPPDH
jgi:signal transduction histidine kinase